MKGCTKMIYIHPHIHTQACHEPWPHASHWLQVKWQREAEVKAVINVWGISGTWDHFEFKGFLNPIHYPI
jgi:hypothetical protein